MNHPAEARLLDLVAPHLRAALEEQDASCEEIGRAIDFSRALESSQDPAEAARRLQEHHLVIELGSESLRHVAGSCASVAEFAQRALVLETALRRLSACPDPLARAVAVLEAAPLSALLHGLRDRRPGPAVRDLREKLPELTALVADTPRLATWEHETTQAPHAHPLLDHLCRSFERKLEGLRLSRRDLFQNDDALSAASFERVSARLEDLIDHGLLPVVKIALLFLDFAKGGEAAQRVQWADLPHVDLSIHNQAAAAILQERQTLRQFEYLSRRSITRELVLQLVAHHGLAGQWVRGETPLRLFAGLVDWLRSRRDALAEEWGCEPENATRLATTALHVIDVCDTAAVREGLLDDALAERLWHVTENVLEAVTPDAPAGQILAKADANGRTDRAILAERLPRLRRSRLDAGEPPEELDRALDALGPEGIAWFASRLANAQLWYCESASAALSAQNQLKLLALAAAQAERHPDVDVTRIFHLDFHPLLEALGGSDPATRYRVRLVDAVLGTLSFEDIWQRGAVPSSALASFATTVGGETAIALSLKLSREAEALLTLLPIYETRSSAAFHSTLKALCDLYGLRKDEFDRLANEAEYLSAMNQARSDKERMLDWVRPSTIVEIGPGGGVVLSLLEERFADSEIIGIDLSRAVVESLRARIAKEGHRFRVIEGDAFELDTLMGPTSADTIIFCSVLHEIYSYVEYDLGGRTEQFRLESVRDMLRAAWRTLRPGGRIVIRDGVRPPEAERVLEFIDREGPRFLRLFVDQFEGRAIEVEWLGATRVRMSAADAMEFLYCYTWGPASFPYEVREQYGVLTYDGYRDAILEWLAGEDGEAVWVDVPAEHTSYLQPGYVDALADKIRLYQDDGTTPARLPDSNALWVIEKQRIANSE